MQYVLLLSALLITSSAFAQDAPQTTYNSNRSDNSVIEILDLPQITDDQVQESGPVDLLIEDVDDLTASFAPVANLEFYATASNLFDLAMTVDRYDEDQLIDNTPKAIDETFPVEGSSRFISVGLRVTF